MKLNDCIYFLTTRLSRNLKKSFDKKLNNLGLTSAMWCVLMVVIENNELTQKEISDILCIETPTVTKLIDNLEKRGFISRILHESDRRAYRIALTDEGEKIKEDVMSLGDEFMKWVTRDLAESEKTQLKLLLEKLYHSISSQ